ncbi:MAG TPA: hypothetical protein VJY34_07440 [Roseiarcus sp.]|nr:hypothetical protein [Roseiarcus sp.]
MIGAQEPCLVVSSTEFDRVRAIRHIGQFLLATAPRGSDIELPPPSGDRGDPFADESSEA